MITKTEVSLERGRKNTWFLAWFHLVPHWSKLQKRYFLQGISLVPGLVPLGSYLVPVCVIHKNRGFAWDGSKKCLVLGVVPLGSYFERARHPIRHTCFASVVNSMPQHAPWLCEQ